MQWQRFLGRSLGPLLKAGFNTIMIKSRSVSNRFSYLKESFWIRYDYTDNLKWRNGWYHEK